MKTILQSLSLLLLLSPALVAKQIPHYRMDSFAFLSDAVVLCEEKKIDFVETEYHGGLKTIENVIQCRILESFKGDIKAGADLEIKYSASFARYRLGQNGYMDGTTNPPTLVKPKYVPAGKAILFLKKNSDGGYSVLTAKLIQGSEILEFRQANNPGPLVLYPQTPEGTEAAEPKTYGVDDFIKDVRQSIEASRKLKNPVRFEDLR